MGRKKRGAQSPLAGMPAEAGPDIKQEAADLNFALGSPGERIVEVERHRVDDPNGDVVKSFEGSESADVALAGSTTSVVSFDFGGRDFVAVVQDVGDDMPSFWCYQLIPAKQFTGASIKKPVSAEGTLGRFHGVEVKHGTRDCILIGPPVKFQAISAKPIAQPAPAPAEAAQVVDLGAGKEPAPAPSRDDVRDVYATMCSAHEVQVRKSERALSAEARAQVAEYEELEGEMIDKMINEANDSELRDYRTRIRLLRDLKKSKAAPVSLDDLKASRAALDDYWNKYALLLQGMASPDGVATHEQPSVGDDERKTKVGEFLERLADEAPEYKPAAPAPYPVEEEAMRAGDEEALDETDLELEEEEAEEPIQGPLTVAEVQDAVRDRALCTVGAREAFDTVRVRGASNPEIIAAFCHAVASPLCGASGPRGRWVECKIASGKPVITIGDGKDAVRVAGKELARILREIFAIPTPEEAKTMKKAARPASAPAQPGA